MLGENCDLGRMGRRAPFEGEGRDKTGCGGKNDGAQSLVPLIPRGVLGADRIAKFSIGSSALRKTRGSQCASILLLSTPLGCAVALGVEARLWIFCN